MKNIVSILIMSLFLSITINAQNGLKKASVNLTPEQKAQTLTDDITKNLNLTSEQSREVYKIQLEAVKNRTQLSSNQKMERKEKSGEYQKIKENTTIALTKVLTEEQLSKHLGVNEKAAISSAEVSTNRLKKDLKLSEEQAKAIYNINFKSAKDIQIIRFSGKSRADQTKAIQRINKTTNEKISGELHVNQLALYKNISVDEAKDQSPTEQTNRLIAQVLNELNLDEDQKQEIGEALLKTNQQISSIKRSDMSIDEQSQAVKVAYKERDLALKSVLSKKQLKKYKAILKENGKSKMMEQGNWEE